MQHYHIYYHQKHNPFTWVAKQSATIRIRRGFTPCHEPTTTVRTTLMDRISMHTVECLDYPYLIFMWSTQQFYCLFLLLWLFVYLRPMYSYVRRRYNKHFNHFFCVCLSLLLVFRYKNRFYTECTGFGVVVAWIWIWLRRWIV